MEGKRKNIRPEEGQKKTKTPSVSLIARSLCLRRGFQMMKSNLPETPEMLSTHHQSPLTVDTDPLPLYTPHTFNGVAQGCAQLHIPTWPRQARTYTPDLSRNLVTSPQRISWARARSCGRLLTGQMGCACSVPPPPAAQGGMAKLRGEKVPEDPRSKWKYLIQALSLASAGAELGPGGHTDQPRARWGKYLAHMLKINFIKIITYG